MESPSNDNDNIINNTPITTTTTTNTTITANIDNTNDIENDKNNNNTDSGMDSINDHDTNNISNPNNLKIEHFEDDEQQDEPEDDDDNANVNDQRRNENKEQDAEEGQVEVKIDSEQDNTNKQDAEKEANLNNSDDSFDSNDHDCNNPSVQDDFNIQEQEQDQQQPQQTPNIGGVIRVQESQEDGAESIELELEDDHSLLLTSLTSLFPDATGLKYRHPETNTLRGVKLVDGRFVEPLDGWSSVQSYICVTNRGTKRKIDAADDEDPTGSKGKLSKTDASKGGIAGNGSDLVVLGLPWTTTEDTMRNYFEQYGEVSMVQVKTDPKSGKSRGFGFVRFAKSSIQNKLLSMRHFIDGRWCDVRIPLSKAEAEATRQAHLNRKIFVGRLPDDITNDDLRDHFAEYGTLTDVFIPKPFRNFAFVTFGTSDMAQSLFKHKHVIKGSHIQISEAIPRDNNGPQQQQQQHNNHQHSNNNNSSNNNNNYSNNFSSAGPQTNSNNYGGSGYGGNNNIHPFNSNFNTHQASSHHFHQKSNFGGGSNFGGNMYQNNRKMHPQSTYYPMPSYATSGPSGSLDSSSYVTHGAHGDYSTFGSTAGVAPTGYGQQATSVNGGQYYKIQQQQQQQQPIIAPNHTHNTYPNQPSYSSNHGSNFSRSSYGSVWK